MVPALDVPPTISFASTHDALESARLLAENIVAEDVRRAAAVSLACGWARQGEVDHARGQADEACQQAEAMRGSAWAALICARAAIVADLEGQIDLGLARLENALGLLAAAPPADRSSVINPLVDAMVEAHEASGDIRVPALLPRLRGLLSTDGDQVAAITGSLRMELAGYHFTAARALAEVLLGLFARVAGQRSTADVQARALEEIAEYVLTSGDRSFLESALAALPRIPYPAAQIEAQAALGRMLREMGDVLRGERFLREAQGGLPKLEDPLDRVVAAAEMSRSSTLDGHGAGADAMLNWARWQMLASGRPEVTQASRPYLAEGFAFAGAHLGDAARMESAVALLWPLSRTPIRDQGFENLVTETVAFASQIPRLQAKIGHLEVRIGTSSPAGFAPLVVEARAALMSGSYGSARQAVGRLERMVFLQQRDVPEMHELWYTLRVLKSAFAQWQEEWGDRAEFVRLLDEAQEALKANDWHRLRDKLRRAEVLLETRRASAHERALKARGTSSEGLGAG